MIRPESSAENIVQKEVPQLNAKTGVSFDYRNEYLALMGYLEIEGINGVRAIMREPGAGMKKYEERFSPTVYKGVINDNNRAVVTRINELAEEFNERAKQPDVFQEEDFVKICKQLETLIVGAD